jgi:hypothetical protein
MVMSCRAVAALLLALPAASALLAVRPTPPLRPSTLPHRRARVVALYEDDPWLSSSEPQPFSPSSLEVLFRYGPIPWINRCVQPGEYNASVRNFMAKNPQISRALAEQNINEFIADSTGYLAKTTDESYQGPQEEDLKPPVGLVEKALVVAWVAVLIPASSFLLEASLTAEKPVYDPFEGLM